MCKLGDICGVMQQKLRRKDRRRHMAVVTHLHPEKFPSTTIFMYRGFRVNYVATATGEIGGDTVVLGIFVLQKSVIYCGHVL